MKLNTRNTHDLGPQADWSALLPLGITPPLAAQVIEAWLRHEHSSVVRSMAEAADHGSRVRIRAEPPTQTFPWRFRYRCVGSDEFGSAAISDFLTDPEDAYFFGDLEGVIRPGEVVGPVSPPAEPGYPCADDFPESSCRISER